jgi:DNA-binding response OmpR family regulator
LARILVVDDDPQLLELYARVLRDDGHEVIAARDGLEAQRRMDTRPDLIVLDLEMPANGYEVLAQVRSSAEHATIPVIVSSGIATGEWALRAGATEFLAKPFKVAELKAAVRRRLVSR